MNNRSVRVAGFAQVRLFSLLTLLLVALCVAIASPQIALAADEERANATVQEVGVGEQSYTNQSDTEGDEASTGREGESSTSSGSVIGGPANDDAAPEEQRFPQEPVDNAEPIGGPLDEAGDEADDSRSVNDQPSNTVADSDQIGAENQEPKEEIQILAEDGASDSNSESVNVAHFAQDNATGATVPNVTEGSGNALVAQLQSLIASITLTAASSDGQNTTTNVSAATPTATASAASKSTTIKNFVVVLDPGHGGSDPGACANGLRESDLTLSIAKYVKEQLDKLSGVIVYLTRTSDVYVSLEDRVKMAYNWAADLFVSIHINAGGGSGYEIYAQNSSSYRNNLHNESVALAQRIASNEGALGLSAHGTAVKTRNYNTSDGAGSNQYYPASDSRGLPSTDTSGAWTSGGIADYLSVLRNSRLYNIPAVLVENLFIDNASNANWLRSDANRKKLGTAIANAIIGQYDLHENLVRDGKGLRYYDDSKKAYVTDEWKTVGSNTYYFGADGYAVRYSQTLTGTDGKQHSYYFNGSGVMQTGWVTWANKTRSFFAQNSNYIPRGAAFTGWVVTGGKTYYFGSDCRAVRYSQTLVGRDKKQHSYYFNGAGVMQTGWVTWPNKTRSYFEATTGAVISDFREIGGKTYYFGADSYPVRYSQTLTGTDGKQHSYYFNGSGVMQTGWVTWANKTRSFFAQNSNYIPRGAAFTGWVVTGGKTYYFGSDCRAVRYSQTLVGRDKKQHSYYFNGAGVMQTGWVTWPNKTRSYFEANKSLSTYGAKYTGAQVISGTTYVFDSNGVYQGDNIMGTSLITVSQMVSHYSKTVGESTYPSAVYRSKGAGDISTFCSILLQEANAEGVRAEVVYAQAMLETNYLRFGGDVSVNQCNFSGIGATGGGKSGNSFGSVTEGLRAQVQHLKAYASTENLNQTCVDPRFGYVTRGSATTIDTLSGKWATDSSYGASLKTILGDLLATR